MSFYVFLSFSFFFNLSSSHKRSHSKTQDCDEVVSSTGRCHWHQIHAHNCIHVTCDTVEAQHADRTSSLVKDVPDPPLPVASEDLVRSGGRHGRLLGAAARRRGNCINTESSAGRPADGFSPVPACLLARRLTQRAEMQGCGTLGARKAGLFRFARSRRLAIDVASEGTCCPTSHCAACVCQ